MRFLSKPVRFEMMKKYVYSYYYYYNDQTFENVVQLVRYKIILKLRCFNPQRLTSNICGGQKIKLSYVENLSGFAIITYEHFNGFTSFFF